MHLPFEASQRANMWLSGTIKQTNTVKLEGHEAENHIGIATPSRNWCNWDFLSSMHAATPGLNQINRNYPGVNEMNAQLWLVVPEQCKHHDINWMKIHY